MPTVFSHVAVPLALGLGMGKQAVSPRLLAVGMLASVLPDLDVLAFGFGVAYADPLGHRGFSHSLLCAVCLAALAAAASPCWRSRRSVAFVFVLVCAVSHGLLDMLTRGGLGVALFWPFSSQRFSFPAQIIPASPLSWQRFFGPAGWAVLKAEWLWVWLPAAATMSILFFARKRHRPAALK